MADKLKEAREAAIAEYTLKCSPDSFLDEIPVTYLHKIFDAGHAHATADMAERVERLEKQLAEAIEQLGEML